MTTRAFSDYTSIINVKDAAYGAVGDGTTDDSAAIRLAIAAGNNIYFPEGTYLVSQDGGNDHAIDLPSGTRIFGAGNKLSKIKLDALQDCHVLHTAASVTNVEISDIEIDGNAANQSGTESWTGIFFGLTNTDCVIKNCVMHDCDKDGLFVGSGCSRFSIQENLLYDNLRAGIFLSISGGTPSSYININNNISYSNGNTGVGFVGDYINVTGNISYDNGDGSGSVVADNFTNYYHPTNKHVVISGNISIGGGNHGIHTGGDFIVISDNVVQGPTDRGIIHANTSDDSSCNNVTISNNNIVSSGGAGIELRDCDKGIISDNLVETAGGHGIIATTGAAAVTEDMVISGNYVEGCTSDGIRIVSGTDIHVIGNNCINNTNGIKYSTATRNSIIGNTCTGNSAVGIDENTSATDCIVANNVLLNNTNNSLNLVSSSTTHVAGNKQDSALTVASAATLTLPDFVNSGDLISVTGTTGITSITAKHNGFIACLNFAGVLTVTDGSNLKLQGNFTTAAEDVLTLICDGTDWYEISRGLTGSYLSNVVEDTTPQLGGILDTNGNDIIIDDTGAIEDDSNNEYIKFSKTASAVNEITVANAATGNAPSISATGDDTNIDLNLVSKGTGLVGSLDDFFIETSANPTFTIYSEDQARTSYFEIEDQSTSIVNIRKHNNSGGVTMNIEPSISDGSSTGTIRMFRSTNTSGNTKLEVYLGNNSSTINHRLGGQGLDSYVCANNGDFGVGTSSPAGRLDVSGGLLVVHTASATIATGAITATGNIMTVDTESAAASDDLDTISGGVDGAIIHLKAANAARTVVAKDGTGNLILAGDFSMDNTDDVLTLMSDGTNWREISRSDNGA